MGRKKGHFLCRFHGKRYTVKFLQCSQPSNNTKYVCVFFYSEFLESFLIPRLIWHIQWPSTQAPLNFALDNNWTCTDLRVEQTGEGSGQACHQGVLGVAFQDGPGPQSTSILRTSWWRVGNWRKTLTFPREGLYLWQPQGDYTKSLHCGAGFTEWFAV